MIMKNSASYILLLGALALIFLIPRASIIDSQKQIDLALSQLEESNQNLGTANYAENKEISEIESEIYGPPANPEYSKEQDKDLTKNIKYTSQGIRIVGDVGLAIRHEIERLAKIERHSRKELILRPSSQNRDYSNTQKIAKKNLTNIETSLEPQINEQAKIAQIEENTARQNDALDGEEDISPSPISLLGEQIAAIKAPIPMPAPDREKIIISHNEQTKNIKTKTKPSQPKVERLYRVSFYDLVAQNDANYDAGNDTIVSNSTGRENFYQYWLAQQQNNKNYNKLRAGQKYPPRRGSKIRLDLISKP